MTSLITNSEKQNWYSSFLTISMEHGYKDAWAAMQYQNRFGCWPSDDGLRDVLHTQPDPAVAAWIKEQQRLWVKQGAIRKLTVKISGDSMLPNFRNGQEVEFCPDIWPECGDPILFINPKTKKLSVKRVVAMEGQELDIHNGRIFIDKTPMSVKPVGDIKAEESGAWTRTYEVLPDIQFCMDPMIIPAGSFFVMGDNRCSSMDSRHIGCISGKLIKGVNIPKPKRKPSFHGMK